MCSRLPVDGVSLILGNELAGSKAFLRPIVHKPSVELPDLSTQVSAVFPACVVTRAQSKKFGNTFDLSDTVFSSQLNCETCELSEWFQNLLNQVSYPFFL